MRAARGVVVRRYHEQRHGLERGLFADQPRDRDAVALAEAVVDQDRVVGLAAAERDLQARERFIAIDGRARSERPTPRACGGRSLGH